MFRIFEGLIATISLALMSGSRNINGAVEEASRLFGNVGKFRFSQSGQLIPLNPIPYVMFLIVLQLLNNRRFNTEKKNQGWISWFFSFFSPFSLYRKISPVKFTTIYLSTQFERKIFYEIVNRPVHWAYAFKLKCGKTINRYLWFKPIIRGHTLEALEVYTDYSLIKQIFGGLSKESLNTAKAYVMEKLIPSELDKHDYHIDMDIRSGVYKTWFFIVNWASRLGNGRSNTIMKDISWVNESNLEKKITLFLPTSVLQVFRDAWNHRVFLVPTINSNGSIEYSVTFVGSACSKMFLQHLRDNVDNFWNDPENTEYLLPTDDDDDDERRLRELFGNKNRSYEKQMNERLEELMEIISNLETIE